MESKKSFFILLLCFPVVAIGQKADTFRVYFLGGQSNMDGYGYSKELPKHINKTFDDVWIFHGNPAPDEDSSGGEGSWQQLRPGHGTGFSANKEVNKWSDRFGIELSFAHQLQQLYPEENIALIKYSRGGTSIDSLIAGNFGSWEVDYRGQNGINQFDHFLNTVKHALTDQDINNDGTPDVLVPQGIIWMQGESDAAHTEAIAAKYYQNLKRLMDQIRAAFWTDDLPIVIGKISDSWNDTDGLRWNYGDLVQYAQEKFVRNDGNAAIIRATRYYKYSDPWHYDTAGYIDLGERFAEAVYELNQ